MTITCLAFALDANIPDEELLEYGMVTGMLNAMETKMSRIHVSI